MQPKTERQTLLGELSAAAGRLPAIEPNLRDVLRRIPNVLGTAGIPALVPYLLPYASETPVVARVLRAVGVGTEADGGLEAVRSTAAGVLVQLLSTLQPRELPLLDQGLRSNHSFRRWDDPWSQVRPEDLVTLPGSEAEQLALLAILTSHNSGFVREAAILQLFRRNPEHAFPFVLVRANDWVEQVHTTALRLVVEFLKPGHEASVARSLPLIQRFGEYSRRNHARLLEAVRTFLSTTDGIAASSALMSTGTVYERRAVTRFVDEVPISSR